MRLFFIPAQHPLHFLTKMKGGNTMHNTEFKYAVRILKICILILFSMKYSNFGIIIGIIDFVCNSEKDRTFNFGMLSHYCVGVSIVR